MLNIKKLFLSFVLYILTDSTIAQTKSFCAYDNLGSKYELNINEGRNSLTYKKYNSSGTLLQVLNGTWQMIDEGVYGQMYKIVASINNNTVKWIVVHNASGQVQELRDESAGRLWSLCSENQNSDIKNTFPTTGHREENCEIAKRKYLEQNPDVARAELDAWAHYSSYGRNEGRNWPSCNAVNNSGKNIIGKIKKIGTLEIAQNDFNSEMTFSEAVEACKRLGSGWRIPTVIELALMYKNRGTITGFANDGDYWSTKGNDKYVFDFSSGTSRGFSAFIEGADAKYKVRAVRKK